MTNLETNPIELALIYLIKEKRFFAELLLQFKRQEDKKSPTVYVRYNKTHIVLGYNPEFIKQFTPKELAGILEHECWHVMCDHVSRSNKLKGSEISGWTPLKNIAADLAINQHIPNIPLTFKTVDGEETGPIVIDSFCRMFKLKKEEVEPNSTFEYYYNLIMNSPESKNFKTKYIQGFDEHKNASEEDLEINKHLAKQAVNKAQKNTSDSGGTIPYEVTNAISSLNYKPKNWKKDIQQFRARLSSIEKYSTKSARNRRQRPDVPLIDGHRSKVKLKLILAVDTSGSMTDETLSQILAEAKNIYEQGTDILLIDFDTKINGAEPYRGESTIKINGRGGTAFNPVFEEINSKYKDYDGVVMFSDGGCNESVSDLIKPKIPILFAMTDGCPRPDTGWGKSTEVIINTK